MTSGLSWLDNPLFYKKNSRMIFGDAKETVNKLIREFSS